MKIIKIIVLIAIALVSVVLDTSYFSSIEILGVSLLSSLIVLLIFSLVGAYQELIVFAIALTFLFAIFSSLPVWLILVVFLLVPAFFTYLRVTYLPEMSFFIAVIFLFLTCITFELILLFCIGEWSLEGLRQVIVFAVLNTVIGFILFSSVKHLRDSRIKIKF